MRFVERRLADFLFLVIWGGGLIFGVCGGMKPMIVGRFASLAVVEALGEVRLFFPSYPFSAYNIYNRKIYNSILKDSNPQIF